ncbi:lysozyme [Sphingobacterium paramultivorum]|uniref:lysozyme n=1 Tax=Sphingobacterium paramultivorum TaxID=2886510 RepID=UPI00129C8090|nr:lysozyme [Sphingobacterium paramultivorum]
MKISQNALRLVKGFEELRLNAYLDNFGVWTLGYGTVRWPSGQKVRQGDRIKDEAEASELLKYSLISPSRIVNSHVDVRLTQNQFDTLVSIVYSIRGLSFNRSKLLSLLNDGDYFKAADAILEIPSEKCRMRFNRELGHLKRRRLRERELFLTI